MGVCRHYIAYQLNIHNTNNFLLQATEFPCPEIANSGGERRLHTRVTPSVLSSANVERKGLGLTKVF